MSRISVNKAPYLPQKQDDKTLNAYTIMPDEVQGGDRFGYKVVASVWLDWHGWGAFRAPTNWSDADTADNGDMIPEAAAKALFPTLASLGRVYGNS